MSKRDESQERGKMSLWKVESKREKKTQEKKIFSSKRLFFQFQVLPELNLVKGGLRVGN